jgi:transcriptional regulator with XRE-family HTH domain
VEGFALRLREERERMGRSQRAFGELAGVTKLTQLKYEQGDRVPSVDYLYRIGLAGADTGYLLWGIRSAATGFDAGLLTACIAAIDDLCSGPAPRRARYAAVLYHICTRTGSDAEMAPILARAMISGRDLEHGGNAP